MFFLCLYLNKYNYNIYVPYLFASPVPIANSKLSFAPKVRATEIQLLQSPEEESWASVRKVLDFRDELDEVAEAMAMGSKLEITSLEVLSTH